MVWVPPCRHRRRTDVASLYTRVYLCFAVSPPPTHTPTHSTVIAQRALTYFATANPSFPRGKPTRPFPLTHTEPNIHTPPPSQLHTPEFCRQSPTGLSAPPSRPRFPKRPQGHARKLGTIFFGEIALFLSSFTLSLDQERKTG